MGQGAQESGQLCLLPFPGLSIGRGVHWGLSTLPKHPPKRLFSPWGDPDAQLVPREEGGRRWTLMSPAHQQHRGRNCLLSPLGVLSWPSSATVAPTISCLCSGGWKQNASTKICLSYKCKPQGERPQSIISFQVSSRASVPLINIPKACAAPGS